METLQDKFITVWLRANGYKYTGQVLCDDGKFITLLDSKDGRERTFNREALSGWEMLS